MIPDAVRLFLSKKYLDWAEKLPPSRWRFISHLQETRKFDRLEAKVQHQKSRPPLGVEIKPLYWRLVEIFQIEDYDRLLNGLLTLFPELERDYTNTNFPEDFRKFSGGIASGGFQRIGIILRKKHKGRFYLMGQKYREIGELPPEIEHIEITIHKPLSSTIFVSIDVHLHDDIAKQLAALQQTQYLSEIRLRNLLPWKAWRGHSSNFVGAMAAKAFQARSESTRRAVEKCIAPYLRGHFMDRPPAEGKDGARLPVIEVCELNGFSGCDQAVAAIKGKARAWWDSMGYSLFPEVHQDSKSLFLEPDRSGRRKRNVYSLVVLRDPYLSYLSSLRPEDGKDETGGIKYHTRYTLDGLMLGVCFFEFLMSIREELAKVRKDVYGLTGTELTSSHNLGKCLGLRRIVDRLSMFLERISEEFDQGKAYIRHEMATLKEMKTVEVGGRDTGEGDLRELFIKAIPYHLGLLKKHLAVVERSIAGFVAVKNMEATYRLQRRVFWLTIVAAAATLLVVPAETWKAIWAFVSSVGR